MQPLEPLKLTLQGQVLIEASAGTGKTYTIELLFLRLLLERGLSVDQILVVTFTRAATEELRGRVRKRIRDALDVLEGRGPDDEPLQKLIAGIDYPDRAIILLSDALTRMDEAAIFTIHGFCQRMLQEHAFESGAPFEMEFLETEQLLRGRIIEDFWRLRFYNCPEEEAAWAAFLWKTPQNLLDSLGGHLTRPGVECVPVIDDEELVRQMDELVPLFTEVRAMWQTCGQEVAVLLRENKRLSRDKSKGYGQDRLSSALEGMERFVQNADMPWLMPKLLELFTSSKINDSLKKTGKAEPPVHPFFNRFDHFFQAHREMTEYRRFGVLLAARSYLVSELSRRKEEQAQLYFDDLLTHLDAALSGEGGRQLGISISKRFPVILVDEFQDTDPLQYRIFATIYASTKKNDPGLFLIGDPKQAIYGFRGADIFTYIQARRDTAPENRFTMTTNYRSTTPMVDAVNQLFDRPLSFLFGDSAIDFNPVRAAGLTDEKPLLVGDSPLPALSCLMLPEGKNGKALAKGTAGEQAARFCAHEIADLLAGGPAGKAQIGDQPLTAGDIAILVRTHNEAELVRGELNKLSITSVYYSQDSVFSGEEADHLLIVLTGLMDLSNSGLVRTGLTTGLFGYNGEQLDRLRSDEQQWEEVMTTLGRYQQIWQQDGFTPMFQTLLAEQKVVSRLHGTSSGERVLTNYLHLAELLQEAAQHRMGAEGLLRWFADQIQAPEEQADNQQLRLESDENLVKIVTIHKAKGLEYPVVFLPFLWAARTCRQNEPLSFHRPEQPNRLFIDLGTGDPENYQLAEDERLAGDLRLLYVAITRARYSCFFCWGRINKMQESALCYLLHSGAVPGAETLAADLESLDTEHSALVVKPYPQTFSRPNLQAAEETTTLAAARFKGNIDTSWQITSFSRLTANHDQQPERPDYDSNNRGQAPIFLPGQPAYRNNIEVKNWGLSPIIPGHDVFGFPRGAAAGTCLHAILELISFTDSAGHEQIIRTQLARAGFDESWLKVVDSWMQAVLKTELEPGFSLARVQDQDRVNEMSFYFPLQSMERHCFNRALQEFSIPSLPDRRETLQGLMVGFIDLVYRYDNRYYVADYKSNHLGNCPADYGKKNMQAAILEHRYDLQYLIYTLALHRFLVGRIREYDYDTHFGGVCYLFLRGMDPENEPGTGVFATRPPFALIDNLDRCCAGLEIN
ncbi:MAG: exodeoxyribonuclease V subunit beta [Thermodesulfobacteriota bacterium]|nr:exodeoxyribonuclease V subunit beta [Thermodesulfobacteriota bacterium]